MNDVMSYEQFCELMDHHVMVKGQTFALAATDIHFTYEDILPDFLSQAYVKKFVGY